MRCPYCSSELSQTSRFCSSCGQEVSSSTLATFADVPVVPGKPEAKQTVPAAESATSGARRSTLTSQKVGRFAPGTLLAGRYRIIAMLGKGGMGEVYRADDVTLDQAVALKFLPESVDADTERLERFYNEVRIARQVSHPNVCRIYDIGRVGDQHFISMEYIDGEDLASLLRRIGRLPSDKALELARQMCAGLAAAHEKGVLHRDLKPANIMIDGEGKVRIADFGLARPAHDQPVSGTIEGTPAYMAPEQFSGRGESVKSDLYSLGLVLYELFTGKPAFKAGAVSELARMHREIMPSNPSTIIAEMNPVVESVILRCLAKDPALRPASALAVAAALPGGDPLAAALAAGETPSPEMVAAAGDEGALRPAAAWAGLGYILLALIAIPLLSRDTSHISWIPQTKTPDALAERCRELMKKFGYDQEPLDTAYGYEETDFLGELGGQKNRREQLQVGQPAGIVFWFRQSPRLITNSSFYRVGAVAPDSPPQEFSNMATIQLDTEGRLVKLDAVPPQKEGGADIPIKPDWNALLHEAGFDVAKMRACSPSWVPPVYADERAAWEGAYPLRSDIPVRIEAASRLGKPVYFQIIQPWTRPTRMETPPTGFLKNAAEIAILIIVIALLVGSVLLAWRNLKLNRGDRRGALKISFYLFLLEVLARILRAHFVGSLEEMVILSWMIVSRALMFGALLWIGYIALEPHIRRLWPHAIITWSRLLAGQLRDPRIGRDILAGGILGISIPLIDEAAYLLATRFGLPTTSALAAAESINVALGGRHLVGLISTQITAAVSASLYFFLLFFLLKLILKKEWLAAGVFVAVMTLNHVANASNPVITGIVTALLNIGGIFLLRRFGLVAVMAFVLFINIPETVPLTANLSVWYSATSVFALLFLAALAAYGFRTSLGGRPVFAFDLLKD